MTRRIIGPFNRVEGDLEVQLEIDGDHVKDAWVVSPLYRGFERILQNKLPMDALVYTPRICGICSVSQSVACASALAQAQGLTPPPDGQLAINLILANENLADHLTHFYLFFMPDFAREIYQKEAWYASVEKRFRAVKGLATVDVLPARSDFLHLMGILAGKWPHSLAIQPGGSTRSIENKEKIRIQSILYAFRRFLEKHLYGDCLERVIELDSEQALLAWASEQAPEQSDLRLFLHVAQSLALQEVGRASDRFMSYGAYMDEKQHLFAKGIWAGELQALDETSIREDISHTWMKQNNEALHPYDGKTIPGVYGEEGYTWCKAPRLNGDVVEVGALARQVVDGHALIRDIVSKSGGNVRNRVIARLLEIARVTVAMEQWAMALQPKESFCEQADLPDEGMAAGMVEAARGSLGHWLKIKEGRIDNYQIIAPTTWNFSPRDEQEQRGALELALLNAPVREGEVDPVSVQHIVRSFDPCMVCTVH